jgi:hypothetical protein
MRRIKLSTWLAFGLALRFVPSAALLFSICILSFGCDGPADCTCETTVCTCDGKAPPEVTPTMTPVMEVDEHVCAADEAKLSATHELVIPCNRTCGGSYECREKCRCVDRSEWEVWEHRGLHER